MMLQVDKNPLANINNKIKGIKLFRQQSDRNNIRKS